MAQTQFLYSLLINYTLLKYAVKSSGTQVKFLTQGVITTKIFNLVVHCIKCM